MMKSPQDIGEQLSAFCDDEVDSHDIDALLDALENPACRAELHRYTLYGQNAGAEPRCIDISGNVAASIRAEMHAMPQATPSGSWSARLRDWLRPGPMLIPLSGMATAAVVAILAFGVGLEPQSAPQAPTANVAAATEAAVSQVTLNQAQPTLVAVGQPVAGTAEAGPERELVIAAPTRDRTLDRLYMQHARYRGGYAMTPPANFARVGATLVRIQQPNEEPVDSR